MIAIVAGCIGLFIIMIVRSVIYLKLPLTANEKLRKIILFTDVRKKSIETFQTLLQIACILWIAFGLVYLLIISNLIIPRSLDNVFLYLTLYGPLLFIIVSSSYLKRKYWGSQN